MPNRNQPILVLMGGFSGEREVSLVSGKAIAEALLRGGWKAETFDWQGSLSDLSRQLAKQSWGAVFNALHGSGGEDGVVQGAITLSQIPATHSNVLSSALAMDKPLTRALVSCQGIAVAEGEGIAVPEGAVVPFAELRLGEPRPRPYVVKPIADGSSLRVVIVNHRDPAPDFATLYKDSPPDELFLVERYIPGRELTVSVLGTEALAVTELQPVDGFYDYEAKYSPEKTRHLVPAPIPESVYSRACAIAEQVHRLLGCSCLSRSDFRWDEEAGAEDTLYFLEINTQPGMTPTSLVPEQAAWRGMDFDTLVESILQAARPLAPWMSRAAMASALQGAELSP